MRIGPWEGVLLGANLARAVVTNGDFMVYVCDSAATWASSKITLGKLCYSNLEQGLPSGDRKTRTPENRDMGVPTRVLPGRVTSGLKIGTSR